MKPEEVRKVALLGAGMIGNGLALHFAKAGYDVSLFSRTQQTLDKAIESIRSTLPILLEGQSNIQAEIDKIVGKIKISTSLDEAISNAPIIIESVAEDLKIKQDLFKELDQKCPKDVILGNKHLGYQHNPDSFQIYK